MLGQAAEEQNKVLSLLKRAITEQLAVSQHEGEAAEECVNVQFRFLSAFRDGDCNRGSKVPSKVERGRAIVPAVGSQQEGIFPPARAECLRV